MKNQLIITDFKKIILWEKRTLIFNIFASFFKDVFILEEFMEEAKRVALIGIMVENNENAQKINDILHTYGNYIIGRMGIPYSKRNISIISVAIDAPNDIINTISGKLGSIDGVSSKTIYSKYSDWGNLWKI